MGETDANGIKSMNERANPGVRVKERSLSLTRCNIREDVDTIEMNGGVVGC
jgi:hypothetical protein